MAIANQDTNGTYFHLWGALRQDKEELLRISPSLKGMHAETYISFINDDRSQIASSVYTGRIEY